MGLAVAIQMDPIDTINIDADSTFALALEAQARGHALFHYLPDALTLHDGRLYARARPLYHFVVTSILDPMLGWSQEGSYEF